MRLIDTDELADYITENEDDFLYALEHKDRGLLETIIALIPTAYEIDNVDVGFGTIYKTIRKDVAIEIVKQGGASDDVCEWKSTSNGEFIQNPHTSRLFSNEPSMKNVHCNTCGKKIKVVD